LSGNRRQHRMYRHASGLAPPAARGDFRGQACPQNANAGNARCAGFDVAG